MTTSQSRLSYPDCEAFLQRASEDAKGMRLPFPVEGAARQFLLRLNTFRKICRKDNMKIHPDPDHPLHGRSEYDPLELKVRGPDAEGEWWVYASRYLPNEGIMESLSELEDLDDGHFLQR